jgi:hypothetical protein
MSAPYTLDCAGAYVEIEREGNGFEARWCGKPIGEVKKEEELNFSFFQRFSNAVVFSRGSREE